MRRQPLLGDGRRHPGLADTPNCLGQMRAPQLPVDCPRPSGSRSRSTQASGVQYQHRRRSRRHRRTKCSDLGPPLQPRRLRRLLVDQCRQERRSRSVRRRLSPLEALEEGIRWRRRECELLLTPEVPQLLSRRRVRS